MLKKQSEVLNDFIDTLEDPSKNMKIVHKCSL